MPSFRQFFLRFVFGWLLIGQCTAVADELFKDVEIRVIKNKSFQKRKRLEGALNIGAVMNKSFVYTYLGQAQLAFHLTETLSFYGEGGYAFSANKSDCLNLGDKFNIEPKISILNWMAGGGVGYTPIYGKFQLASGDVLYYDWYFSGGLDIVNTTLRNKSCIPSGRETVAESKATDDASANLTGIALQTGQRFFANDNLSINWSIRALPVLAGDFTSSDGSVTKTQAETLVILSLGVGYFL